MSAVHTSGLWIAKGRDILWYFRPNTIPAIVAKVAGEDPEAMANARLIAAAPVLLEALQWAVTAADRLAEVTPKGLLRSGIETKAAECHALIKLATGEPS